MAKVRAKITNIQETAYRYKILYSIIDASNQLIQTDIQLEVLKSDMQSFKPSRVADLIYDALIRRGVIFANITAADEPELFALKNTILTFDDDANNVYKLVLDFGGDVTGEYGYGEVPVSSSPINLIVNKVTRGSGQQAVDASDSLWAEITRGMGELSTVTFSLTGGSGTLQLHEQGAGTVEVAVGDEAGVMDVEKIKVRWTRA